MATAGRENVVISRHQGHFTAGSLRIRDYEATQVFLVSCRSGLVLFERERAARAPIVCEMGREGSLIGIGPLVTLYEVI